MLRDVCVVFSVPVCLCVCVCLRTENPKVYNEKIHRARDRDRGRTDPNSCVAPKTGQTFVA